MSDVGLAPDQEASERASASGRAAHPGELATTADPAAERPTPGFASVGAVARMDLAVPTIELRLRAESTGAQTIDTIALRCEVLLDPERDAYRPAQRRRVEELFGRLPGRMPWTRVDVLVPRFREAVEFGVVLPCGGRDSAAAMLCHALEPAQGEAEQDVSIPLLLQPSGTIFYEAADGRLQRVRMARSGDVALDLPLTVARQAMRGTHALDRWIALSPETLDRLREHAEIGQLPSLDAAVSQLLTEAHSPFGPFGPFGGGAAS